MRLFLFKPIVQAIVAIAAVLIFASSAHGGIVFSGPVTQIDGTNAGHVQFPQSEAAVYYRPYAANQKSLLVENYFIRNLTNQKALDIRATRHDSGIPAWAYSSITLRNLRIYDIERREDLPGGNGLHIDHIRIAGGGNKQDCKTNILIENVELIGGDALPILITDGVYGTITLRNVTIKDTTLNNVQFKTDKVGSIDRIVIENSPGIGVALIGRPGSIKDVDIINSANARVGDTQSSAGKTGADIDYFDANGTPLVIKPAVPGSSPFPGTIDPPGNVPVPEPTLLAPVILGLMVLTARRRRA